MPSPPVAVISILPAALFAVVVYRLFFHPLANIPGPKLAGISTLYLAWHARQGKSHQFQPALHKKYGRIVRIAPNQVLVCSDDVVKTVYSKSSRSI